MKFPSNFQFHQEVIELLKIIYDNLQITKTQQSISQLFVLFQRYREREHVIAQKNILFRCLPSYSSPSSVADKDFVLCDILATVSSSITSVPSESI